MKLRRFGWMSFFALPMVACASDPAVESEAPTEEVAAEEVASAQQALVASAAEESFGLRPELMEPVRELILSERHAEAREVLEQRLATDPNDVEAALLLTAVDLLDEQYESAHDLALAWLEVDPSELRLMERKAMAALLSQDLHAAKADFEALVTELSQWNRKSSLCEPLAGACAPVTAWLSDAKAGLATVILSQGDVDGAENVAREQLTLQRGTEMPSASHHFVLALAASERGNLERAEALYRAVLEEAPDSAAALNNLGGVFYERGDLATALQYYTQAYEAAGIDRRGAAIAWINIAEIDMLEGRYEESLEKLLEATEISARYPGTYLSLGVLYDVMGKPELSQKHMEMGLRLDAEGVARRFMAFYKPEWGAHFNALVAEQAGNYREARALWEQVAAGSVSALHATARLHLARLAVL